MELVKVDPEQENWTEQYNLMAYYGNIKVGSLIKDDCGEWYKSWEENGVVDELAFCLDGDLTFEDAREIFLESFMEHCEDQKNYYKELSDAADELLNKKEAVACE